MKNSTQKRKVIRASRPDRYRTNVVVDTRTGRDALITFRFCVGFCRPINPLGIVGGRKHEHRNRSLNQIQAGSDYIAFLSGLLVKMAWN